MEAQGITKRYYTIQKRTILFSALFHVTKCALMPEESRKDIFQNGGQACAFNIADAVFCVQVRKWVKILDSFAPRLASKWCWILNLVHLFLSQVILISFVENSTTFSLVFYFYHGLKNIILAYETAACNFQFTILVSGV